MCVEFIVFILDTIVGMIIMLVFIIRMGSPEDLYECGIFISDLSMHDSSRDYILAGSQQNPELTLALNQVMNKHYKLHTL